MQISTTNCLLAMSLSLFALIILHLTFLQPIIVLSSASPNLPIQSRLPLPVPHTLIENTPDNSSDLFATHTRAITGDCAQPNGLPNIRGMSYKTSDRFLNATFWLTEEPKTTLVNNTFRLPGEANNTLLYHTNYQVSFDVDRPGIDYFIDYWWDPEKKSWVKEVYQQSEFGDKLVNAQNVTGPYSNEEGEKHVDISIDLDSIGSPRQYVAFPAEFVVTPECRFSDFSHALFVPRPEFPISVSPNGLTLRPGEESSVEVKVESNYYLPANVSLILDENSNIDYTFVPQAMSLSPLGTASSNLYLRVPEGSQTTQLSLQIFANIYIETIDTQELQYEEREFPSSTSIVVQKIVSTTILPVTILPPPTIAERFNDFYETFSIPPEFIAAFYGIVLTALVGWLVPSFARWYKGRMQGKHVRECMKMVIEASNQKSLEKLTKAKDDIALKYADDKISEEHYNILRERISEGVNRNKQSTNQSG